MTTGVSRIVESSGFKFATGISLFALLLSIAPVLIYMGRIDNTIETQGQDIAQQGHVINAINETMGVHGTALATLQRDIDHVSRLQDEVRQTLRDPAILRPDPWTGAEDAKAMRDLEQRIMDHVRRQ